MVVYYIRLAFMWKVTRAKSNALHRFQSFFVVVVFLLSLSFSSSWLIDMLSDCVSEKKFSEETWKYFTVSCISRIFYSDRQDSGSFLANLIVLLGQWSSNRNKLSIFLVLRLHLCLKIFLLVEYFVHII